MSSTPSDGGPSHQDSNISHNYDETSYGSYTNQGYHASGQGSITHINHQTTNYRVPSNALKGLQKHCSPSAAFNSAVRFDPPRCAASTRLGILQTIEKWMNSDAEGDVPSSLFWLHGGAGVGKSALAQSLCEKFQKKELAASFFFFRGDAARNNGNRLIPTLVSQLVGTVSFKEVAPFVEERIRENPNLFTKIFQVQGQELLVEPLLALKNKGILVNHPRLIVIDGLDECENPSLQCELLRAIARVISQIPYPIRFFVTSRPEAHITEVFNHDRDLQAITVHRYNLSDDPDADMDIRKFLEREFAEIHRVHRLARYLPHAWPSQKAITSLVDRSSGHFIYASTVIRYIQCPRHRPADRLDVILRLRPPQEGDRPYDQLDALYSLIFKSVESPADLEKICLVLGILYFQSKILGIFERLYSIEVLLGMEAGDLVMLVDPILSLVTVDDNAKVRILHKSLFDYLLDHNRGGHLPFDLARVHEASAIYILEKTIMKTVALDYIQYFAYHCHYAYLNDTLKSYLHSLEVPYPKLLFQGDGQTPFLHSMTSLWHFFRTLSCADFDSTRQMYGQCMAKCMDSAFPGPTRPLSAGVKWLKRKFDKLLTESKHPTLKPELSKLLMKWKPPNFNPKDHAGKVPVSRYDVGLELDVFSAYSEAYFSRDGSDINALGSSLVSGDHFIHSYNFGIRNDTYGFLILRTYSRHGNMCYQGQNEGYLSDLVSETTKYLQKAEKYLFSEVYQKYGLEPD